VLSRWTLGKEGLCCVPKIKHSAKQAMHGKEKFSGSAVSIRIPERQHEGEDHPTFLRVLHQSVVLKDDGFVPGGLTDGSLSLEVAVPDLDGAEQATALPVHKLTSSAAVNANAA
jgi:hypothetical protein